ncbi:MAG TPA: hypothetical protein VHX52_03920 [Steroidobacteraceae bacterium]|nr:hypothetical protein [Steroidobacteraceae bacterium]
MTIRLAIYAAATIATAALMSACGGGGGGGGGSSGPAYTVSVDVAGLSGSMVLQLNAANDLTVSADGTSSFSAALRQNASYSVTVQTQPATQYCAVSNGSGTVAADVTVNVTCNASVGGTWYATAGTDEYLGLVDEMGDFYLIDITAADTEFLDAGTASVVGTTVSGNYLGVAVGSATYPDGSVYGNGTLTGTVTPRASLDLTAQFTTSMGTLSSTPLSFTYNSLYERASTLATIAGNFTEAVNEGGTVVNLTVTISDSGALYSQDPNSGCVENGSVSIINPSYNMYRIQYLYANCTGAYTYLNGLTFSGIGTLDNETSPEEIIAGTSATTGTGGEYLGLLVLQRD